MRRNYEKPMIAFDELTLDTPIATGCSAEAIDDAKDLIALGYFGVERNCRTTIAGDEALDEIEVPMLKDNKLCYYTAALMLFTS